MAASGLAASPTRSAVGTSGLRAEKSPESEAPKICTMPVQKPLSATSAQNKGRGSQRKCKHAISTPPKTVMERSAASHIWIIV